MLLAIDPGPVESGYVVFDDGCVLLCGVESNHQMMSMLLNTWMSHVCAIEKIEGKVLTLRDAATRSVKDAVVRHCDDAALQAAVPDESTLWA